MSAISTPDDYDELRRHVRGTQHARSIPLLVIGALLVNYAVANFSPNPIQWRYGAPLAFVLIWALNKLNEQLTGVGAARGDYLVAAGAVFIATNVLLLFTRLSLGANINVLFGAWVAIVGLALAVVSRAGRDRVLLVAGVVIIAAGAAMPAFGSIDIAAGDISSWAVFSRSPAIIMVAGIGALLGLAGLLLYRSERATQ